MIKYSISYGRYTAPQAVLSLRNEIEEDSKKDDIRDDATRDRQIVNFSQALFFSTAL